MEIAQIVIVAVLIEALTEVSKDFVSKISPRYLSLFFALLMTVAYRVDLLRELGFACPVPYLGVVLTGLLVSRGSQFLHDLYQKITQRNE
jgi:hypothetical protein